MRILALALLFLAGCHGPFVQVNLLPTEEKLTPQPVFADPNPGAAKVAMLDVRGMILDGQTPGLLVPSPNPVDRFAAQLAICEKDPAIKAVIVRITSPGGTVTGSDIMHQELRRFSQQTGKPVVASLGEVAASGGYYLAVAADRIVTQPTTITASIGVIMPTVNLSGGLKKLGIVARSVKSGPNKDIANPLEPIRDSQYAILQGMVDEYYARFKALVIERRPGMTQEHITEATDGRIVSGQRAVELGLADELGGVREAFAAAKLMANLKAATLIKFGDPGNPARSAYANAAPGQPEINLLQVQLGSQLPGAFETSGFYYLWMPN